MITFVAAAADSSSGVNPLFFILGALALIIVSTLGPLSRMHERRDELKNSTAKPEGTDEATGSDR